jgi:Domain of unknown function (DUF4430)
VVALALAGCGLDVGLPPSAAQLLITRGFGAQPLHRIGGLRASEGETVRSLLLRYFPVGASAHGSLVASIGGLHAGAEAAHPGQTSEWFYYVNGVRVTKAPAHRGVNVGDHVWWDLHDASQEDARQAIVGAFPEPFLNGVEGRRLPVRVECASPSMVACGVVTESLRRAGVPAAVAAIGSGGAPETLRVMVGSWRYVGGDLEAQSIGRGPRFSGVYVRFSANGEQLTTLDEQGEAVQNLGGDTGLVAATSAVKEAPVWVVTGTDAAGVELAADAFNERTLADRFAVVLQPGVVTPLPVPSAPTG